MPDDHAIPDLLDQGAKALVAGDLTYAIDRYERALAIDPALPDAWFNLAWARRAARQFDAALTAYAEAVGHGLTGAEEAFVNRAAILSDHLFRRDDAVRELETALERNPGFVPAWLSLGVVQEDKGDAAAARAAYERVLALAPGHGRAVARLAALDVVAGEAEAAMARVERQLPIAGSSADRSEMLFALGAAQDATGRYREAFRAITQANRIAAALTPRRYDRAAMERLVDRQIATFPAAPRAATRAPNGAAPIFICGMFRSGSTLFERLLASDPRVTAGGELEFIPALVQQWPDYPEAVPALTAARIDALRGDYLAALPAGGIVTDKRCDNVFHIGLILTLFPDARIVHTERHPLDTLLSVYFLPFGDGVTYDTNLGDAAHYYAQYRRMITHWRAVYPDAIVDADYDRLVRDPERELARVFAALGLDNEGLDLDHPSEDTTIRTASGWQARQPLHARSSGRWRHYRDELAAVTSQLAAAGIDPGGDP